MKFSWFKSQNASGFNATIQFERKNKEMAVACHFLLLLFHSTNSVFFFATAAKLSTCLNVKRGKQQEGSTCV
jgi:hypothetical protein